MELRDKVAAIVREARENQTWQRPYADYADAILSLPELKEALAKPQPISEKDWSNLTGFGD
jgi:hypothetical protein